MSKNNSSIPNNPSNKKRKIDFDGVTASNPELDQIAEVMKKDGIGKRLAMTKVLGKKGK